MNNKYDIREFNSWLKKQPKDDLLSWGIDSAIEEEGVRRFFFEKIEDVERCIPTLNWSEKYFLVLKRWIEIKDKEDQLISEEKISSESEEKKQLREVYDILFPSQNYDFDKLKEKLKNLRIKYLSLEIETKKKEMKDSIKNAISKNERVGKTFELLFEILNKTNESENRYKENLYDGEIIAYKKILESIFKVDKKIIKGFLNECEKLHLLTIELKESTKSESSKEIINEIVFEENYCLIENPLQQ